MVEVGNPVFHFPTEGYLTDRDLRDKLKLGSFDFVEINRTARRLGFMFPGTLPTREGWWEVWHRQGVHIPSFPEGTVEVGSMLGLYSASQPESRYQSRQVILSPKVAHPNVFEEDLKAISDQYLERRRVSSFPSRWSAGSADLMVLPGIIAGTAAGLQFENAVFGLAGFVAGMGIGLGAGHLVESLGERRARSEVADRHRYLAGESAYQLLRQEYEHVGRVLTQRELYQQLVQEDSRLTPEYFLKKIYSQLPSELTSERAEEWRTGNQMRSAGEINRPDTADDLLKIARVIWNRSASGLVAV